jgi:hypothetical protein
LVYNYRYKLSDSGVFIDKTGFQFQEDAVMKRNVMLKVLAIMIITYSLSGCYATQQPWNLDQPSGGGAVATATPAASTFAVAAVILAMGGAPGGTVMLVNGATPVTGATVTVNGATFSDMGGGNYTGLLTGPFATGVTITLNVTSSAGNVSASGAVPATGGTTNVTITGAATGSILAISF